MVTLHDVATHAGVSTATVSRVFARPDKVSPATADRVIRAADELGYVPNGAARALATGLTGLIGLVVPSLSNSYFSPIITAVQATLEQAGFELLVADSHGEAAREAHILTRLRGRVDGVITASPRSADEVIAAHAAVMPLVTINAQVPGVASVAVDVHAGLAELCSWLLMRGHRNLVYLGGPAGSRYDDARYATIRQHLDQHAAAVTHLGPVPPKAVAGAKILPEIRATGATAVIAYNALVGSGIVSAAVQAGVRVPDELAVVAVDDLVDLGLGLPAMTAIRQPMYQVGVTSAEMLVELAAASRRTQRTQSAEDAGATPAQHRVLPTTLVTGATA